MCTHYIPFPGGSWAEAVSQGSSVLSVLTWDVRSLKLFTIECYPVPALYMSAPFSVIRSASSLFILATQSSTEFSSTQPTSTSKLLFRAVSFTYIIKSVHLFLSAALSTHHRKLIGAKKKLKLKFYFRLTPHRSLVPKNAPFDSDEEWRSRIAVVYLYFLGANEPVAQNKRSHRLV